MRSVRAKVERLERQVKPKNKDELPLGQIDWTSAERDDLLKAWHIINSGREYTPEELAFIMKVRSLLAVKQAEAELKGPIRLH